MSVEAISPPSALGPEPLGSAIPAGVSMGTASFSTSFLRPLCFVT